MQHHSVTDLVDPSATGPARQLGVVARLHDLVAFAAPFAEALEHDGSSGHVDPESQGLGGEYHLQQPSGEKLLDGLFERGDEAGVMSGGPCFQL